MLRTVTPLFRLPRDSTLRSLRERLEFLKLACLYTINKLQLSLEWRVQSDIFDIHAVHAN